MSEVVDIANFLDDNGYLDIFEHIGYNFLNRDAQSAIGIISDSGEPFTYLNGDFDEKRMINIQLHHYNELEAIDRADDILNFLHLNNFVNRDNSYNYVHIINIELPQKQEILTNGNSIYYINFRITRRKS